MKQLPFITLILFFIIGCNNQSKDQPKEKAQIDAGKLKTYEVIADTIINDIVIKNPNNDEWTDFCLRKLDKASFVDYIFEAVYAEELTPYDFFDETVLTIDDIQKLENNPEFDRNKIAKVQYEEAWYYDKQNNTMIKKVHSIMLAYEIYNSQGEIKGYKPAFKVYFNNESIQ